MDIGLVLLVIFLFLFLGDKVYENYVNYPTAIKDCGDDKYYAKMNKKILSSNRLNSQRPYFSNKDMYSLNSEILKDKKCEPNGMPTSFF
jgi:hypothetical protein